MPIYEYKCQQCGSHLEVRQSVSDSPLTTCEKCHGKLEKQWSLSGFQFKGAGWYVTDYAAKKSAPGESTTAAESASKPVGDTKPSSTETKVKTDTTPKPKTE